MSMRPKVLSVLVPAAILAAAWAREARAQGSWPGCSDVADSEFRVTPLVTRAGDLVEEPMKMAFESAARPGEDAGGKVHVYFTERKGRLRKYDAVQGRTLTLAAWTLSLRPDASDGLLGIALDPDFRANHHLYLYYTQGSGATATWRVSRFTLNAAHDSLDKATEKVLLDIPIQIGSQHPGGALQFDAYGDLYITTGDNHMPGGGDFLVHTSANTNDLRAKILRIRPRADGGYDVPDGNLFREGEPDTRPEIYIMGTRNPYTLSLDPVRRWVLWGDVGPDYTDMDGLPMNESGSPDQTEEYNLAKGPGNYGYPFFAGRNFPLKSGIDPAAPAIPAGVDWSGARPGKPVLPEARPAIKAYRKACAVTGPIYRYDGDLNSSVKFPPHFHRKWFTTDFNAQERNPINLYTLDAEGTAITGEAQVLRSVVLSKPLDMQFGPDGALYVINYAGYRSATASTGIVRIEYTGSCRPPEPKLEIVPAALREPSGAVRGGPRLRVTGGEALSVDIGTAGDYLLVVRDLLGRPAARRRGRGDARLGLEEIRGPGVYLLELTAPEGRALRRVVRE